MRKSFLLKRQNQQGQCRAAANDRIVQQVTEVLSYIKADSGFVKNEIGMYYPLRGEPDITNIVSDSQYQYSLPKLNKNDMYFVRYTTGSLLRNSAFAKIKEPVNNDKQNPVILLVPAIALSKRGERLGFGAGHYDRYICKYDKTKRIVTIGLCFNDYLVDCLPQDNFDLTLDYVVTDKMTYQI